MAQTSAERNKKWRDNHPEEARQGAAERAKKWREEHPEESRKRVAEATRRYRARLKAEKEAAKAAAIPEAPESTVRLSDEAMGDIYQDLQKKGLV